MFALRRKECVLCASVGTFLVREPDGPVNLISFMWIWQISSHRRAHRVSALIVHYISTHQMTFWTTASDTNWYCVLFGWLIRIFFISRFGCAPLQTRWIVPIGRVARGGRAGKRALRRHPEDIDLMHWISDFHFFISIFVYKSVRAPHTAVDPSGYAWRRMCPLRGLLSLPTRANGLRLPPIDVLGRSIFESVNHLMSRCEPERSLPLKWSFLSAMSRLQWQRSTFSLSFFFCLPHFGSA